MVVFYDSQKNIYFFENKKISKLKLKKINAFLRIETINQKAGES